MKLQRADESRAMALYAQDNPTNTIQDTATWGTLPNDVRLLAEARFIVRYGRPMQPPHPADIGMTPQMIAFGKSDPPEEMPEDEFLRKYEHYYNTRSVPQL